MTIKEFRKKYRLTQKTFGLLAGVTTKTVSKWECNSQKAKGINPERFIDAMESDTMTMLARMAASATPGRFYTPPR